MSKLPFILLVILSCGAKQSLAQPWAISGASWYYDFYNPFPTAVGYIHIQKSGDSLVNSKVCDKLIVFTKWWSAMMSSYDSSSTYQFTYQRNDTVFYYSKFDSTFYILYDFNATPSNAWNVYSNCNLITPDTDTINVDSTGNTLINGDTLKHLWTSSLNSTGFQFWDKIVERIGCLGYMFPYAICFTDQPIPPTLRCYSDSTGWAYQADITTTCDYIYNGINDNSFSNYILFSPNPTTNTLSVHSSAYKVQSWEVVNILGEIMMRQTLNQEQGTFNLDVSSFPAGVYYLKISSEGNSAVKKFIKM